jgi:hypothetical protein
VFEMQIPPEQRSPTPHGSSANAEPSAEHACATVGLLQLRVPGVQNVELLSTTAAGPPSVPPVPAGGSLVDEHAGSTAAPISATALTLSTVTNMDLTCIKPSFASPVTELPDQTVYTTVANVT